MIKKVLGVRIDDISLDEALAKVFSWLAVGGEKKIEKIEKGELFFEEKDIRKRERNLVAKTSSGPAKVVVTPGPEFLVGAQKDSEFREILNNADLSLPDGFGLQLLAGVKNRVPGTDFMLALCKLAAENGWSIGLLGGRSGVARKAAENLQQQLPKIKVVYTADGAEADRVLSGSDTIHNSKQLIDVLFVAFGHPRQEKLLWRLKTTNFKFRVGVGVGGAFDYIAGRVLRAPSLIRIIGLEWLWRLLAQPWRFERILKATVVFPLYLFWEALKRS